MRRALLILIASTALATATMALLQRGPRSTLYKFDELTASQIAALDRERTIVILPVGMLEQHGPGALNSTAAGRISYPERADSIAPTHCV